MLSAFDKQGTLVIAWDTNKECGPFYCPECERGVTLKKGQFIVHHFAHNPGSNCSYGTGESWEHWQAKFEMYHALSDHPLVSRLQVELPLGPVRPDICFRWNEEADVAVELQRSTLSPDQLARRTSLYAEKQIAVLWVILPHNRFWPGRRSSTRLWERYLHELYGGVVYCWHAGEKLEVTRLDPYVLRTECRERYDKYTRTWDFKEVQHFSKRSRVPCLNAIVRITEMRQSELVPQQRGLFTLPGARLWSL